MADLQTQLQAIIDKAVSDAQALVAKLVKNSVEQALTGTAAPTGRGRGRVAKANGGGRVRRTPEQLKKAMDKAVHAIKGHKDGISAEVLQKQTHMPREELSRALQDALKAKAVTKKGKKRATKYFAA